MSNREYAQWQRSLYSLLDPDTDIDGEAWEFYDEWWLDIELGIRPIC